MAGYTRQSIADIINGAEITAPPLNAEFNQLSAAFNGVTGHSHDGSSGNAPKINLGTSVIGYLPAVHGGSGGKNNFVATTAPTVNDDSTQNYAPGSLWENTTNGRVYICIGANPGVATWRELVQVETANKIVPIATNTVDIGTVTTRYKDMFLSGVASIAGAVSVGSTLSVTGATTLSSTLSVTGLATLSSVDINGGNIDGTTIGATTPAAATFSSLTTTGFNSSSVNIDGGSIDNTPIGSNTASTIVGTNIVANSAFFGDLVGGVTGNVTGNLTGNVAGDVIGDVVGNISASGGTSTFNDVVINGSLNMNLATASTIINLSNPVNAQDAATKNYVDTADALKLSRSGGVMTGNITMGGHTVTGLAAPVSSSDAATKGYVDAEVSALVDAAPGALDTLNELAAALGDDPNFSTTITNSIAAKLPLAGGTMTGPIAMSNSNITALANPVNAQDAATKAYVDSSASEKLSLVGGTMSGILSMGSSRITNVGDPLSAQDASTKAYTDQQDALLVSKSGDTMSGNLAMGGNSITGLANPTADDHATNKVYVDGILGSATAAATSAANAATSASNAATSEANAAASESAAASSAAAALTSETNALASEVAAASSEANAATSETNAAASATSASASASSASTSETNAAASASSAATSASNAQSSETAAAQSETNAAASEIAASISAGAASTSAALAESKYDQFDDRYLGPKSTAPSTDNDGDPLLSGALYWNTTVSQMYVFDGSSWSAAVFDTNGAMFGANNLSDVADAGLSRSNLGLGTTDNVQFADVTASSVDLGSWVIVEVGGSLYFQAGGVNKMKLDASGNLQITGVVDTVATIS